MEKGEYPEQPDVTEVVVPKAAPTLDDFLIGLTLGYDERPQVNEPDI